LKPLLARGANIAWINDAVGDPEMQTYLLEFDTVHGRWRANFAYDAESVTIDESRIPFIGCHNIVDLPLEGVDVVIDSTGVCKTEAKLAPFFEAGVKRSSCPPRSKMVMRPILYLV
jgi:glyceraldehyde 3-phosphate dehydrogenase